MFDVFEQPWTLIGAAVLVLFGMLTLRSVFPEKRRRWQLLVPICVAVAAFGLDLLVKTDLEKVNAVIKTGIKAVEEEDVAAIASIIADNYYDSHHKTKQSLIDHARRELSRSTVEKNKKAGLLLEISPPEATAIVMTWLKFAKNAYAAQNYKELFLIKVELHLQKQPDGKWLISRVDLLEIDRQPFSWRQVE
jgi:hypothetical protein